MQKLHIGDRKKKYLVVILEVLFLASLSLLLPTMQNKQVLIQSANTKQPHTSLVEKVRKPGISVTPSPTQVLEKESKIAKTSDMALGFVVSDYTNGTGEIETLQQQLGRKISTISLFKHFGLPSNNLLDASQLSYIKSQNIRVLVAWEPWNPQEGMHQSTDYLQEVADGKQDEYIKKFAESVKSYGGPVTIRFGHEMNGDWYPWAQRPDTYKTAYRRVVEVFRNEGVANVTWMWSVNASPAGTITQYYPGNEYIDIIGIDGFNFGTSQPGHTWVSFSQIFKPAYNIIVSNYNKPVMISETASSEIGGNKPEWIKDMFISASKMPGLREIIWFNLLKETDWRITSSDSSLAAFK